MTVYAQSSRTLATITDVKEVYPYYYLASSSIDPAAAPHNNANPEIFPDTTHNPGSRSVTVIYNGNSYIWTDVEPSLIINNNIINDTIGQLYVVECTIFSNNTYNWGPLMTSSTYAAAKAAYNNAIIAKNATDLLGGHFIYKGTNTVKQGVITTPSGAGVIQTINDDPANWGYNTWIGSNGIQLRTGEESYATLNTNGLILNKGGIRAGELNENNFVYVSSEPYGENYSINNTESNDWKQIIGTRFGIRSDGTLYATGAHIAESIEAENLKIGQWTTFDHRLKLCAGTYNLSNDTEVQRGKVYFEQKVIDGITTYEIVTPSEGDNPHNENWCELVQNVPSDWTDHRDQYFVASQYEDDYDNIDASAVDFGGSYYTTTDNEVDKNKIYYERVGSGTELDPFKYNAVEPNSEDDPHEEGWYELQKLFYEKDMDSPQMVIGNKGDFAVTVDNTQITFWYDHQKVAFINGDRMQIPRSVMLEEMLIGQKKWSWREHEGNLQLKWIGD